MHKILKVDVCAQNSFKILPPSKYFVNPSTIKSKFNGMLYKWENGYSIHDVEVADIHQELIDILQNDVNITDTEYVLIAKDFHIKTSPVYNKINVRYCQSIFTGIPYCTPYFLNHILSFFDDIYFDNYEFWWRFVMICHKIAVDHHTEYFEAYFDICAKYSAKSEKFSEGRQEREWIKNNTYPHFVKFSTLF